MTLSYAPLILALLTAQTPSPVATAFRSQMQTAAKNLGASADEMPADKYGYKPTPKNMSFAEHMNHMATFNETMCELIGGAKPPQHAKLTATATKAQLASALRQSFAWCATAVANLDDSKLGDMVTFYGSQISRADAILILSGDWSDHYAVTATYLRLNGLLPPTAK
jgi:uncharacterized damage-inducible protein DinB